MATKTFKIGLSNTDKQNMAQDVYERLLALTFPEYDTTESYEVGDFVVYNDQLYKCIGSTSGTWDATKWQLATLNDLLTDIEDAVAFVNDKANVDGNYPTMTVGNADQLNSTVYVVDKVPYLYRTSGGDADIGNREYDKIIGGSLVVNQLVQNGNFENTGGWSRSDLNTSFAVSNNVGIVSGITARYTALYRDINVVNGHKYFVSAKIKAPSNQVQLLADQRVSGGSVTLHRENSSGTNTLTQVSMIVEVTADNSVLRVGFTDNRSSDWTDVSIADVQVVDLTQMFGSTIADYIYALEQANTGAGVAWFRNYFQELYYPYNSGAIKNVKLVSHDMVGFNQWDEDFDDRMFVNGSTGVKVTGDFVGTKNKVRVLPNTQYYIKFPLVSYGYIYYYFYDENETFISAGNSSQTTTGCLLTTPSNCAYMYFMAHKNNYGGTTYKNDICINLSWSGWRNGQYEPYQKNSYPLDTTIELRGIPKLDSDNHLYFDGDEYSSDGKVVRKYGIVDLGTLNYFADHSNNRFYTQDLNSVIKLVSSGAEIGNMRCSLYVTNAFNNILDGQSGIGVSSNGTVTITDIGHTSDDAATFKTAMSGVYLIYELATPTEETATPFQEPQIVDDFGTEEYVVPTQDGWQVPVGHDTKYPANLRDKLQRLPDMPSVSQNVTETYVVNYNGTTKKCTFVDIAGWLGTNGWIKLTDISGYDATKTQTLKNVEGTLTWVDD